MLPSGYVTKPSYWKYPSFIVSFSIKHGDFPILSIVFLVNVDQAGVNLNGIFQQVNGLAWWRFLTWLTWLDEDFFSRWFPKRDSFQECKTLIGPWLVAEFDLICRFSMIFFGMADLHDDFASQTELRASKAAVHGES